MAHVEHSVPPTQARSLSDSELSRPIARYPKLVPTVAIDLSAIADAQAASSGEHYKLIVLSCKRKSSPFLL